MKFQEMLTANSGTIKASRAKLIASSAEEAQSEIVRTIRKELRALEFKLLNLTDIAPESELSLMVVKKDFNAYQLFEDIQSTKVARLNKKVELQVAEETYSEWFDTKTILDNQLDSQLKS